MKKELHVVLNEAQRACLTMGIEPLLFASLLQNDGYLTTDEVDMVEFERMAISRHLVIFTLLKSKPENCLFAMQKICNEKKWTDLSNVIVKCLNDIGESELTIEYLDSEQDLKQKDWFYDNINRSGAEKLLVKQNQNGGFLIRLKEGRSHDNPYSLSVFKETVYHIPILYLSLENRYALGREKERPENKKFPGLEELVDHYTNTPMNLIDMNDASPVVSVRLTSCPRKRKLNLFQKIFKRKMLSNAS